MSTVKGLLRKNPKIKWIKAQAAPLLTESHGNERLKWAQHHVTSYKEFLKAVMFSDERKFKIDGPDGFHYYWNDLSN